MKVKDLINQLKKLNPNDEIIEEVSGDPDGHGSYFGVGFQYKLEKIHDGFYSIELTDSTYDKDIYEYTGMKKPVSKRKRRAAVISR
jgi:hypothetical protein